MTSSYEAVGEALPSLKLAQLLLQQAYDFATFHCIEEQQTVMQLSIGPVPCSWPSENLQAMTYSLRTKAFGNPAAAPGLGCGCLLQAPVTVQGCSETGTPASNPGREEGPSHGHEGVCG